MPSRAPWCAGIAACVLFASAPAQAQERSAQDVVEALLRDGPRAAAIRADVDVVRKEQAARLTLPNPSVSYAREGAGFTDFLQVEQALPFFGVRRQLARAGPNFVMRENAQRGMVVQANVAGRDLRGAVAEIRTRVGQSVRLPQGYRVEYGGQFESEAEASRQLLWLSLGVVTPCCCAGRPGVRPSPAGGAGYGSNSCVVTEKRYMIPLSNWVARRRLVIGVVAAAAALYLLSSPPIDAHGVSSKDARFLQSLDGPAPIPLLYLGAKHMVTGYDHLLFLVGVVFFLHRSKDILLYVSLFTLGHSLTLLGGALGNVRASAFLVDAVIGLSIVYKGFENMGGFKALGVQPNTRVAVFAFGLVHGFGLATKLQEYSLSRNGLVTNIVSFNGGVEIGQFLALTAVLLALGYWRTRPGYLRHAYLTNAALMTAGFVLAGYQLTGYFMESR